MGRTHGTSHGFNIVSWGSMEMFLGETYGTLICSWADPMGRHVGRPMGSIAFHRTFHGIPHRTTYGTILCPFERFMGFLIARPKKRYCAHGTISWAVIGPIRRFQGTLLYGKNPWDGSTGSISSHGTSGGIPHRTTLRTMLCP